MSLTKLCKPSETALRQLFNRQLFWICVLSLNGEMAPNSAVSHEFDMEFDRYENQAVVHSGQSRPLLSSYVLSTAILIQDRD